MAFGADRSEEMIALAKAVHRAMNAFNDRNPQRPAKIDSSLSRILMLDPDYSPKRTARRSRPPKQLSIFTIKSVADRLQTTVGALLGEEGFDVAPADVQDLERIARELLQKISHLGGSKLGPSITTSVQPETEGERKEPVADEGTRPWIDTKR